MCKRVLVCGCVWGRGYQWTGKNKTLPPACRNYSYGTGLDVKIYYLSIFLLPACWVQYCTAADNAVCLRPASWINRLLSVNIACLWHSSLLHILWFQGKFSPSVHGYSPCCFKEGVAWCYSLEVLLPTENWKLSLDLQPYLLFLSCKYSVIHTANISECNMSSMLLVSGQHLTAWKFMECALKAFRFFCEKRVRHTNNDTTILIAMME